MSEAIEAEVVGDGEALPVVVERETSIVRAAGNVGEAFQEYQRIQAQLDHAMPDCIMQIGQKKFRKKSYWRAIATAFNLTVEPFSEKRDEFDGDWGYVVSYRATAPNGRSATGDGACFASEKRGSQLTVHNVRSHAHTRGFNRSVSNLVGFGEVSADEMDMRGGGGEGSYPSGGNGPPAGSVAGGEPPRQSAGSRATEGQVKKIWAQTFKKARALMAEAQDAEQTVPYADEKVMARAIVDAVFAVVGVEYGDDGKPLTQKSQVDALLRGIEGATLDADGAVSVPGDDAGPF